MPDRVLGAHLPVAGGMVRAVDRANMIGADAIQLFADNPTAWRRRFEPSSELPAFRRRLAELAVGPVAIHASYLVNLAGPDPALHQRSVEVLEAELASAPGYAARFVIVHVGSHRGSGLAAGIDRVADAVARALAGPGGGGPAPMLVLENSAGAGGAVGATLDELGRILAAAGERGVDQARLGICLDTAHLWGAGIPIGTAAEVDTMVAAAEDAFGLERLVVIHLNDSKAEPGSLLDRHQHLGAGRIGREGLTRLLAHPRLRHVIYYLETPGMDEGYDAVNIARARDLAMGRPLAPLPPEALDLGVRGGRTAPEETWSA